MGSYRKTNLRREVDDQAPRFQMPAGMQARFARRQLGGETFGLSLFALDPGFRIPFGHKHVGQEEVYVIVRGGGRIKVEDEIVAVEAWDAIRFAKDTMRNVEAGPAGIEFLAFGAGTDASEVEMVEGWWAD